jgi:hypothetical protein
MRGDEAKRLVAAALRSCSAEDVRAAVEALDVSPRIVSATAWPGELEGLNEAGLYSWWVDAEGAAGLSEGLRLPVDTGRIYAGQAGATKWPSGTPSTATLGSRIRSQHLGGNIYGSTFRLTLASCLASPLELQSVGRKRLERGREQRLTAWIKQHLSVAVHPYSTRDALESLEHRVLDWLDPPLNLRGMAPIPLRVRLHACRKALLAQAAVSAESLVLDRIEAITQAVPRQAGGVTLHEEIAEILREHGNWWMSTQEIANFVNERGRYRKRDGSEMSAFQIHGRTRNYEHLFERQGSQVRLREPAA